MTRKIVYVWGLFHKTVYGNVAINMYDVYIKQSLILISDEALAKRGGGE